MGKVLTCLVVWLVVLHNPHLVAAEEISSLVKDDWETFNAVDMKYRGKDGVWVPLLMANKILAELEQCSLALTELDLSKKKSMLLLTRLELKEERIVDLKLAVSLSQEIEEKLQKTILLTEDSRQRAEERAEKAEEDRDAWYRHPVLWMSVGIVLAVVCGVVFQKIAD